MNQPIDYKTLTGREKKRVTDNYNGQKSMARKRGIEWQFTRDTWLEWWGADYHQRGQGRGKLCCARKNDTGPYSPDNCIKLTHEENSRQMQARKRLPDYEPPAVRYPYIPMKKRKGIPRNLYRSQPVQTPYGRFDSIKAALEALNLDYHSFRSLCDRDPNNYYKLPRDF